MRVRMMANPWVMFLLALPAIAGAFPSDSLLLVRIATSGSSGDSLKYQDFTYATDDHGFWYETDAYRRHDSVVSMQRRKYDPAGRDVFDTTFSLLPDGRQFRLATRTEYDGAGHPLHAELRYDDSIIYVLGYQYDASGKLSKRTLAAGPFDSSGASLSSVSDYAYDPQGRLRTETHSIAGVPTEAITYGYDSAGRLGSSLLLKADGDTTYAKTFAYDGGGRLIREITAYGNDTLSLLYMDEKTEYDANGMVKTKKQYDKSGYLMSSDTYTYETVHVPVSLAPRPRWRSAAGSRFRDGLVRDALGRRLALRGEESLPGFIRGPAREGMP